MSVDNTLLLREIDRILKAGQNYTSTVSSLQVQANGKWIKPFRLDYLQCNRDYSSGQLGDVWTVEFLMQRGDFTYDVLPYRDGLMVDLTETPLLDNSTEVNFNLRSVTTRFKAILNLSGEDNITLTNKNSLTTGKESLNQLNPKIVSLTLIDELVYKMMMVSVGTTLNNMTASDMLVWLHQKYAQQLGGTDTQRMLAKSIVPGFNPTVFSQVQFPDGMLLKDVARFLQNDEGGVYPTGLGRYIQDQVLYIYPLFDTTRYKKNAKVLNLINVPNDRYEGAEHTFENTDRYVTVLATGGKSISEDTSLADKIQNGNGVRFGNADQLFNDFAISKDNRMLIDRATNLSEVITKPLQDGINNVRWAAERMTANSYKHFTAMAQKDGQPLKLTWNRGDRNLLSPAMPVKYQTMDGDTVKTYYGVLLGVDDKRTPINPGATVNRHAGLIELGVFISRTPDDGSNPSSP